jgi:folate-dependent phosphoribosylglycinamide formyltransferase PurN
MDYPMNIAILTTDSYFSYLLISDIVSQRPEDIACVIITPSRIKGKGELGTFMHVLKKTGWSNLSFKVIVYLWFIFAEFLHKIGIIKHCVIPSKLAKKFNISLFISNDCNDEQTFEYLKSKEIDFLVSINVYQRIQEPVLHLPSIAAINNHFGLLPNYKGMAPYIWAMANGEKEIGLSVHHMVINFDEGRLIKQERMPLYPRESSMQVYLRGCTIARKMITEAIALLEANPDYGIEQTGEGSYFSMPTRECIKNLKKCGYSLFRIKDLFTVFKKDINGERLP